jgi:DNA polymerase-3 subunit epsilon
MGEHLSLRLRVFLFFALIGLGGAAALAGGLWFGHSRYDADSPTAAFVIAGIVGGLGLLGIVAWVWLLFDENVSKPILKLAGGLRTHAHASEAAAIDAAPARYLGDLGPAAQALTANLARTQSEISDVLEQSTEGLANEKAQLQALLATVPAAILMCSADHRVVFYNGEAAGLLDGAPPQLGRHVFHALRREPVEAAYDRLEHGGDTEFVCGTMGSDHTLRIRMRRAVEGMGYTLVLHPLGRVSATRESWPVTDFSAAALVRTLDRLVTARGLSIESEAGSARLSGDPLQLAALLGHLVGRLATTGARSFSLLISEDGDPLTVTLGWAGEPPKEAELGGWLEDDLDPGVSYVSGRSVLDLHGTTIDLAEPRAGRAALRLTVPRAKGDPGAPSLKAVFDFALAHPLPDSTDRLRDLVFVVFDTETTGLDPQRDEIVQLAALRMVNARIVPDEAFDTLVDPERHIPAASTKVHGISDEMVCDAPRIDTAGRLFHRFAEDAVLVAHNAPFDMGFFARHESRIARRFDHPVLDTVLLSAIVYGQSEDHSLDALIARLGITIDPALRHTAMGDAEVTAKALEKLVPMLEDMGLVTLSDVISAARRHGRLLKDLN